MQKRDLLLLSMKHDTLQGEKEDNIEDSQKHVNKLT
jgi:hypothetical protein